MSDWQWAMWMAIGLAALAGSALFSGLETGIYSINRVRLHVLAHGSGSGAATLERLITRPNRLLGTLLVGNNVANYAASLAIAVMLNAAGYDGWTQVAFNAALLTPLLLIFGEVLPKDFFRSHSDSALPFARPLLWTQRALVATGILPLIDLLSGAIRRAAGGRADGQPISHPRRIVTQLMREGVGHGVLSADQSEMIDRVLEMKRVTVGGVMVEWSAVTAARVGQPPEAIWSVADRVPYSRLPLLNQAGEPVGFIDVHVVLRQDPSRCPPLSDLAHPMIDLDASMTCREALLRMQREHAPMGLVRVQGRVAGIVTPKDLIEPIVGTLESW